VEGRLHTPFVCVKRRWKLLQIQKGETDLIFQQGKLYLCASCDIEPTVIMEMEVVLGAELVIINLAYDTEGIFMLVEASSIFVPNISCYIESFKGKV